MALGILVPFALSVVMPYARTGVPPTDWTPVRMLVALLAVAGLFAYLGFTVYQGFATVISEQGVSVPTLRGRRAVRWEEVQRVGVRGHELLLAAPSRTVVINLFCFVDTKSVATYVQSRLAAASPGREGAI